MCRVAIRAETEQIDLSLPDHVPLAALLPAVVGMTGSPAGAAATDWQLSRPGEPALHSSLTLADNGVRDGELLLLSPGLDRLDPPRFTDVADLISATHGPGQRKWSRRACGVAAEATAVLWSLLGAALLWRGVLRDPQPLRAVTPGIIACAALVAGVVARRVHGGTATWRGGRRCPVPPALQMSCWHRLSPLPWRQRPCD
jgi:type VII secretion integral membrane protein EccD